jgi:channel protein (hemolysin III family)
MLFSVSAIYHRVPWVPAKKKIWRRWDHANINLLIAGSYTPFAVALLEGRDRTILLSVVWIGAAMGVGLRVFWLNAPRWLICRQLLAVGMGRGFLHSCAVSGGWFMGITTNRNRWALLFSGSHLLRAQATRP